MEIKLKDFLSNLYQLYYSIDADWIKNPYEIGTENFFENTSIKYTFNNFFRGCFCYHWHNKWNKTIENNSIIELLNKIIDKELHI